MMNRNGQHTPTSSPASGSALEARIARALSQAPQVSIPETFAFTVARRAIAQPPPQPPLLSGWGPRLALLSGVLLTLGMFALAPHATPSLSSIPFDAELLLLTELSTLVLFANRFLPRD